MEFQRNWLLNVEHIFSISRGLYDDNSSDS